MDNLSPETDNLAPETGAADAGLVTETSSDVGSEMFTNATLDTQTTTTAGHDSWKQKLSPDLRNSPLVNKFADDPSGFENMVKSHHELEKVFSGHQKVAIPKGDDDVDGWNAFSKAMGIPDKAEGYGLADPTLPDPMKDVALNKNKFAELAHAHKLTPGQAKGLWEAYTEMSADAYNKVMQGQEQTLQQTINRLKGEWGDAYDTNVELGQMVINKFSDDQEMNDYLTATLSQDPRGIKFLAKVGDQFAENNMGEFKMKRFSLGPEQAQEEIDKIVMDHSHPYNNPAATPREREAAIDYVNGLYATIQRAKR